MTVSTPIGVLSAGVASYEPYLDSAGRMNDPVIGQPTQYGTAYHALCQAVLAAYGDSERREHHQARAVLGFDAALRHITDSDRPIHISEMDRETGRTGGINHRDFSWPALMRIYRILQALDAPEAPAFADRLAAVAVPDVFRARPPSNWAMVWVSGEWLRYQLGLSPFALADFDSWLAPVFDERISLDKGLYHEPGHPNSYDLFTRFHLADMLLEGYDGAWHGRMSELMDTGLKRSLDVQLSDGSLASAHRSTGQTWTLGAQCAYFTHAARWFAERDERGKRAERAAQRAFASLTRWQRPDGPFSPVENVLPASYRVGYEPYTADGHYGNLALGFLAIAIARGMVDCYQDPGDESSERFSTERSATLLIEGDPTWRALAHRGQYSVHINGFPAQDYDGFGVVDVTFGPGRRLHFVSSVRHLTSGRLYNPGLALRERSGLSELRVVAQTRPALVDGIQSGAGPASLVMRARIPGAPYLYQLRADVAPSGVRIQEGTPGWRSHKTLLVPYLRDGGSGQTTSVQVDDRTVRLRLADEVIAIVVHADIEYVLDLPYGFENRRGLCGLLRIDLAEPIETVMYELVIEL